jgi:imidazolonepropionase-like amidohydrolase
VKGLPRRKLQWLALVTYLCGVCSLVESHVTVITGATIIDGSGRKPITDGVIVLNDERIASIGPRDKVRVPQEALVIDAKGKYAIPGLMDANVHLVYGFSTEYFLRFEAQFEDIIREGTQVALKSGVTTVFDTWGPLEPLKHVRREINDGAVEGSRLFVGGNIVGLGGPFSPDFYANSQSVSQETVHRIDEMYEQGAGHELVYMSPEQVGAAIEEYLDKGMDFFKFAISGHADRELGFILFSPAVQHVMVQEARRRGLVVETHTTSIESLRMAVSEHVDLMQHCNVTVREPIPDDLIRQIAFSRTPCAMQFYPLRYLHHALGSNFGVDPRKIGDEGQRSQSLDMVNQRKLVAAGATILMMTDGGVAYADDPLLHDVFLQHAYPEISEDIVGFFGRGHAAWARGAWEAGMSPMAVLQSMTRNVASAYKKISELGTLEAGKYGDVVILDKDPLSDPTSYASISIVIKAGKVIDLKALPRTRVLTHLHSASSTH